MSITLKVLKLHPDATIPTRGSTSASGLDLSALTNYTLAPWETKIIKTGIAMEIPTGFEIQVRPRSGLSLKTPLRVANSIGTVDQDYQGDISVIMWNASNELQSIKAGDRIAQAVLCPVVLPLVVEVETFSAETKRGVNGFGSTGMGS